MGKIAFVFSGQGAQYSGMGKELCENYSEAKAIFDAVDAIRPGTSAQCFEGTIEELTETKNTQPCMFAVELSAAKVLESKGIVPQFVAGFSLGEIAALTYAGCVSIDDGFKLVSKRGELMQKDAEKVDSAMAAVLKLTNEEVEKLCSQFNNVYPVNYNCPGQVSVAGLRDEIAELTKAAKAAGGRAVPLKVKGAFHSVFMSDAAEGFKAALNEVQLSEPNVTLYSDYTGKPYEGDKTELLSKQIMSPVRWQSIVEDMIANGVDTFIEVGPGKTLCGLISKTDSTVRTFHVEDMKSLEETLAGVMA
jgi:[acyl-carrier-protein] S-malonyltransferase